MRTVKTVSELIVALGGQSACARSLGMVPSAPANWCRLNLLPGYLFPTITQMAAEVGLEVPRSLFRLDRKPGTGRHQRKPRVDAAAG